MICLIRLVIAPLIFACVCQFASSCKDFSSDTNSGLPAELEPVPVSDPVSPENAPATAKPEKTFNTVWVGDVSGENPLDSAADIYSDSPVHPAGIYEYQGLVFCIVDIPLSQDTDDESLYEMEGMLKEKTMLREHYNLPASFLLQRRVLENEMGDTSYRYATVYKLKDIQALQSGK